MLPEEPGVRVISLRHDEDEFDYIFNTDGFYKAPNLPYLFDSAGNIITFSKPRSPGEPCHHNSFQNHRNQKTIKKTVADL